MNGFLAWAKRQREDWIKEILLIESGVKTTSEVREGRPIDTTAETLADRRKRLKELGAVISENEGGNA